MLGTDMSEVLLVRGHEVVGFTRETLDITDAHQVAMIASHNPDIVINCAAYTNVELAETDEENCLAVNTKAVENLADLCRSIDATLVQISTDYVFDGEAGTYKEDANKNPLSVYGQSKADAEDIIATALVKYYIVRTAWLYGKNGKNFVKTVHRICSEKGEMQIVNDQVGCPTYTKDLAEGIADLLGKPYGIYHLTNSGSCTWYEFAEEIVAKAQITCTLTPCTSTDFPQKAKRPSASVLQNTKTNHLRSWQEALQDYLTLNK